MKRSKKIWLCTVLLFCIGLAFVAAQEVISADDDLGFRAVRTPATIEQLGQPDNSVEISDSTGSSENKEIGYYDLESVTEDGEIAVIKDLKDMYALYGMAFPEYSLLLNKDGTGKLTIMDDSRDITWDATIKTITCEGDTLSYTFNDNILTIFENENNIVFVKKN